MAGIIIGTLVPEDACFDVFKDLKIPVIYNFRAMLLTTLPIGAILQIENEKIFVTEPIVKSLSK
ncbi:MAG: hypothetical protein FWC41_06790 [Firmicutes bacterium]|nr:hypothetical protein [Bacillota bacterium]